MVIAQSLLKKWRERLDLAADLLQVPRICMHRVVAGGTVPLVCAGSQAADSGAGDSGDDFAAAIAAADGALQVNDARRDARWSGGFGPGTAGMVAAHGLPLRLNGAVFATLSVMDRAPRQWSDAQLGLLRLYGELIEADLVVSRPVEDQRGLSLNDERFRLLVENVADDFFLHDDRGCFLDVNQHACDSTGYSREELLTMNVTDVSVGELTEEEKERLWADMVPGSNVMVLSEHRRRDGSSFPVEVRITCQVIHGQKLFMGMARDVTERIEAERAMRALNADLERRVAERTAQMQESSRLLKAVMDHTDDKVFVKDVDGRYLMCNHATATLMKRTVPEVIGRTDAELFSAETARVFREQDQAILAADRSQMVEERVEIDGQSYVFHASKSPYRDEQGRVIGLIGISRDVTSVRNAEIALRQAEARWQFALDGSGDGVWDRNMVTGEVFYSRKWKEMLGYDGDEDLGNDTPVWADRVHPDDLAYCIETIERLLRDELPSFVLEHRMRAKDGSWRWILDRGKVVERAADGTPLRLIGTHTDITARKEAEQALRESEARWQFALEGSGDGVWDWKLSTNELFFSRQLKAMFGYEEHEMNESFEEWERRLHPDDVATNWEPLQRQLDGEQIYAVVEHRVRARDGSYRWIRDRSMVVEHTADGKAARLIGTYTDITAKKAEEEQRLLEQQRLRLATDAARLGIWEYNPRTHEMISDERWHEIFEVPYEGPVSHASVFKRWVHPDDVERMQRERATALAQRQPLQRLDFRIVTASGRTRWLSTSARLVEGDRTRPDRLVGIVMDVTDTRQAEERLRHSYEALKRAETLARIGSWSWDVKLDQFTCSDMLYQMYEWPREKPLPQLGGLDVILPADDFSRLRAAMQECMGSGTPFDLEVQSNSLSGQRIVAQVKGQVLRDEHGQITDLIGTIQDVTDRRRMEHALREERNLLRTLIDHLPLVVFITDPDDGIRAVNATLLKAFRLPADADIVGRRLHDFIPGETGRRQWADSQAVMASGVPRLGYVERMDAPDGTPGWRRTSKVPWRDAQGRVIGLVGLSADITDEMLAQRKIEEQAQQLVQANADLQAALQEAERQAARAQASEQAKTEFLAMMSHEIRTPMNTVVGMTRLTLQTRLAPKQRNYLEKIDTSAKALVSIINDVLDFSKIEAGKLEMEEVEFTLESLLEAVSAVTAIKAEEKGLEIAYAVAPDVPDRLVGDSLRLGQVLINLISNAVKFTDSGEVVVSVETRPGASAAQVGLHFAVRDTGIGLSEEQMAGLFRAFSQGDSHVTRRYGGTGLGLAISRRLVEQMAGEIWVTSELGKGSCFMFTVQVRRPLTADAAPTQTALSLSLTGRRVLVVDDNASAREILASMVDGFGLQVQTTDSGPSALLILRQASQEGRPFELVLMDWRMPGMDGLDAAQRIREDPDLAQVPAVLMVTAYGREEVLRRAEQIGLQGVLIKPVTESMMFNTVVEALQQTAGSALPPGAVRQTTRKTAVPEDAMRLHRDGRLAALAGRKVLVVDDNLFNREVVGDFLLAVGTQVETAVNGIDALAKLERDSYDAVLMDVHMPEMDGLTAAREIRRQPRWRKLPVIALTAQARVEDRKASTAAGMDAHLTKPIDERLLYETLLQLFTQGGVHPQTRDTPAAAELDLSALRRAVGGNDDQLQRLLRGFVRNFQDAPAQIDRELAAGNVGVLAELAHAVRGAASYLHAQSLCAAAEEVEAAAQRGDLQGLQRYTGLFRESLAQLLDQLGGLLDEAPSGERPLREDRIPELLQLIGQVRPRVESGDYAARSLLDLIGGELAGTPLAPLAEALRSQFDELELELALDSLLRLHNALQSMRTVRVDG